MSDKIVHNDIAEAAKEKKAKSVSLNMPKGVKKPKNTSR